MSSLVERLRVRSEKRPVYNLDGDSDDDFVVKQGNGKGKQEKEKAAEKIARDDAVIILHYPHHNLVSNSLLDFNSRVYNAEGNLLVKNYNHFI